MLAPIDPKTGEPVPKKDRDKFVKKEDGFLGRHIDRSVAAAEKKRASRAARGPHPGLRPLRPKTEAKRDAASTK